MKNADKERMLDPFIIWQAAATDDGLVLISIPATETATRAWRYHGPRRKLDSLRAIRLGREHQER